MLVNFAYLYGIKIIYIMKKLFFAFALTIALISCNKETTTPNNSGNNTTDTTKTSNDVSISGFDCAFEFKVKPKRDAKTINLLIFILIYF